VNEILKNSGLVGDEWLCVRSCTPRGPDPRCFLWSASSTQASNSQTSAQTQGAQSPLAAVGSGNKGNVAASGTQIVLGAASGKGAAQNVTIETLDPEVAEAAITGEEDTSDEAISGETYTATQALEFGAQTETQANVNTGLAFSTIDNLTAGNTAAQEAAALSASAAALNAANGYGVSGTTGTAVAAPSSTMTTTPAGGTTTSTGATLLAPAATTNLTDAYYFVGILAALGALWYYLRTKKKAA